MSFERLPSSRRQDCILVYKLTIEENDATIPEYSLSLRKIFESFLILHRMFDLDRDKTEFHFNQKLSKLMSNKTRPIHK